MDAVLRASIVYLFLLAMLRSLGRREIGEMSPVELVVLLTMGDLVQQGVTQEDYSLTGAFLAVGTMALWAVALSHLSFRFPGAAKALEGSPIIVVRDGKLLHDVLKRHRVKVDEVHAGAREHGIGNLDDVSVGIFEAGGDFTFIRANERGSRG